jgi:hypothetical protein
MFLDLPDPYEVRIWIRIVLSSNQISKKNLDSYCFVASLRLIFEKLCTVHVASKRNRQKNITKVTDENSRSRVKIR